MQAQWGNSDLQTDMFNRWLAVRWTWSQCGQSGMASNAAGNARKQRIDPLPGYDRTTSKQLKKGDLNDLFTIYSGLDSGRIVLVGEPGAGKSGAMISLLLDAIKHRDSIQIGRAHV